MFSVSLRIVKVYNWKEIVLILPRNLKNVELHANFTRYFVYKMALHFATDAQLNIHERYCCFLTTLHLHVFDPTGTFKLHFVFDQATQLPIQMVSTSSFIHLL
jgi:hypothetical protein